MHAVAGLCFSGKLVVGAGHSHRRWNREEKSFFFSTLIDEKGQESLCSRSPCESTATVEARYRLAHLLLDGGRRSLAWHGRHAQGPRASVGVSVFLLANLSWERRPPRRWRSPRCRLAGWSTVGFLRWPPMPVARLVDAAARAFSQGIR